jgi:DNA-binding NarL/FixJ family response regulator
MKTIKILIADDAELVCEGLRKLLSRESDFVVVDAVDMPHAVLEAVQQYQPDVVLMDLWWWGDALAGLTEIVRIKQQMPNVKVIGFSQKDELLPRARGVGADAVIRKEEPVRNWVALIRQVHQASQIELPKSYASLSDSQLTAAQKRVARLLVQGKTNKEIGAELFIEQNTVKRHLGDIYTRLDVDNAKQALAKLLGNPSLLDD